MSINNWLQLTNKTVIITGAGSGIGSAIAKAFTLQGCNTLLVDVHEEHLQDVHTTCQELQQLLLQRKDEEKKQNYEDDSMMKTNSSGGDHYYHNNYRPWSHSFVCDVTLKDQVRDMMEYTDTKIVQEQQEQQQQQQQQDSLYSSTTIPSPPPFASILVNAAGITRDGLIHNISEANYDDVLNTNMKGTFLTCQAFCHPKRLDGILGLDKKNEVTGSHNWYSGSIINIGSIVSQLGNVGQTNYAASKGGVVGFTKALAKEMALYSTTSRQCNYDLDDDKNFHKVAASSDNQQESHYHHYHHRRKSRTIRVNAILPGFIDTPMSEAVPDHIKERIKQKIPLKEFGSAEDVADMTLFLASDRSRYVTGTAIECSGMISL